MEGSTGVGWGTAHLRTWSGTEKPDQAEMAPVGFATHSARRIGDHETAAPGFNVSEVSLAYTRCQESVRKNIGPSCG